MKTAKYRKATGVDGIIVERLEAATIVSEYEELLRFFREIWEHEVIPIELSTQS